MINNAVTRWYEDTKNIDEMRSWDGRLKIWEKSVASNFVKNGYVLDVGCGLGREAFALENIGFRVTGIDISSEAIKSVRQIASERHSPIEFILYNGERLPFNDAQFDACIIWSQTFGLMYGDERKEQFLRECGRVLKTGGILSYSGHDYEYVRAHYQQYTDCGKFYPYANSEVYWELYSVDSLSMHALKAGFDVITCDRGEVYTPSDGNILHCLCKKV